MRYEIKFPFNFNDLNKLNTWINGIKNIKKFIQQDILIIFILMT